MLFKMKKKPPVLFVNGDFFSAGIIPEEEKLYIALQWDIGETLGGSSRQGTNNHFIWYASGSQAEALPGHVQIAKMLGDSEFWKNHI